MQSVMSKGCDVFNSIFATVSVKPIFWSDWRFLPRREL